MKKIFLILMALPLLMCSCSNSNEPEDPAKVVYTIDKPYIFSIDEAYDYPDFDPSEVGSLRDRFAVLQIPDKTLKKMTTRALLESGVSHPLAFYFHCYNEPLMWVGIMMENFNGFVEVQKRDDRKIEMQKVYEKYKAEYEALRQRLPDRNDWRKSELTIHYNYILVYYMAVYLEVLPDEGKTLFDLY